MTCTHPTLQINEDGICCDCGSPAKEVIRCSICGLSEVKISGFAIVICCSSAQVLS